MENDAILAELCDVLAELYPHAQDSYVIADLVGIARADIPFDGNSQTNWPKILAQALRSNQLDTLLHLALREHGAQRALQVAYGHYCQFIAAHGCLEPSMPSQVNAATAVMHDVNTQGDFVGRDQTVQGDKLAAGNVNAPTAIGHGASVTVIQHGPHSRTPLQRPPRAEYFQDRREPFAHLLDTLHPGAVITLCGPGGIGKSALAAEVIWHLAPAEAPPDRFPDGVIFHSFYHQRSASLALEAIARAYGEEPHPTPAAAAQRALAGRRLLLVLDGADETDDLAAVLAVCDRCGVLITSRKHGDAPAEWVDIAPLPPTYAANLLQAWGRQRVTGAQAMDRVCELVGGLPLALRLVGRLLQEQAMNLDEFVAWLDQSPLHALDQGERRLQSVPLLLERSLAQLNPQARAVLGVVGQLAMAPFHQGAIMAALELSTPWAALKLLGELVNYGLLVRQADRYEVTHALIHTYARRRLAPEPAVVLHLAAYFTKMIDEQQEDREQLDAALPHVRVLLDHCLVQQAWQAVQDLAAAIDEFLSLQDYNVDRLALGEAGLTAARSVQNRINEGRWLITLGHVYYNLGQSTEAVAHYEAALAVCRASGECGGEADCLDGLGVALGALGRTTEAIGYHEQALQLAASIGDEKGESRYLRHLGWALMDLGKAREAIGYHERALAITKAIGDRRGELACFQNLGGAYFYLDRLEQAQVCHEQALVLARALGDRSSESRCLLSLGNVHNSIGQPEQAIIYYNQALTINRITGRRRGEIACLGNLGLAHSNLGQLEQAIIFHKQALQIAITIKHRHGEGKALGDLANAYRDLGQVTVALPYYEQAIAIAVETRDRYTEVDCLGNLGCAYRYLGEAEQAIHYCERALALAIEIETPRHEGMWLGGLGAAYHDLGQLEQARTYLHRSLAIAEEVNDVRGVGERSTLLGNVYCELGETATARQYHDRTLQIATTSDDRLNEAIARGNLAALDCTVGDFAAAFAGYEGALSIAKAVGDRRTEEHCLGGLGSVSMEMAEYEQAQDYFTQALTLTQAIDDRRHEARWLTDLGFLDQQAGHIDAARQRWEAALHIYAKIQSPLSGAVEKQLAALGAYRESREQIEQDDRGTRDDMA